MGLLHQVPPGDTWGLCKTCYRCRKGGVLMEGEEQAFCLSCLLVFPSGAAHVVMWSW